MRRSSQAQPVASPAVRQHAQPMHDTTGTKQRMVARRVEPAADPALGDEAAEVADAVKHPDGVELTEPLPATELQVLRRVAGG